jgi:hypothetical protein
MDAHTARSCFSQRRFESPCGRNRLGTGSNGGRLESIAFDTCRAGFVPNEANSYLVAVRKTEKGDCTLSGPPWQFTKYGATLTVYVLRG